MTTGRINQVAIVTNSYNATTRGSSATTDEARTKVWQKPNPALVFFTPVSPVRTSRFKATTNPIILLAKTPTKQWIFSKAHLYILTLNVFEQTIRWSQPGGQNTSLQTRSDSVRCKIADTTVQNRASCNCVLTNLFWSIDSLTRINTDSFVTTAVCTGKNLSTAFESGPSILGHRHNHKDQYAARRQSQRTTFTDAN